MTSNDEFQAVAIEKVLGLFETKVVRALAYVVGLPGVHGEVDRVTPEKVTELSLDRYFLKAVDSLYVLDHFTVGRDSSMDGEIFSIDESTNGQRIEDVHNFLVDCLVVFGYACVNHSIHSCLKLKIEVSALHSWFPRSRWILFGYLSL